MIKPQIWHCLGTILISDMALKWQHKTDEMTTNNKKMS